MPNDLELSDERLIALCRPHVHMNGSHEMPDYVGLCRAVISADRAIRQPPEVANPELCREADGGIALDWMTSDRQMLSMSLSREGRLVVVVSAAGVSESCTTQIPAPAFHVLDVLLADGDAALASAAGAPAQAVQPVAEPEPMFYGRWHHGQGDLCCDSMRYMRADFDTQPAPEVREGIFDWICTTMNAALDRWRSQERVRALGVIAAPQKESEGS